MKHKAHVFCLLLFAFLVNMTAFAQIRQYALGNNESLQPGQVLYSANGLLKLQFQNHNLVEKKGSQTIWHSKNWGTGLYNIKTDRLLFVNGEMQCWFKNQLTWSSKTNLPASKLILDNDGIIKIVDKDNRVLWENIAGIANTVKPPLVSGGPEGPFTEEMMYPTNKIKLYALFVDWPDAKGSTNNFDSLWNIRTSNGELFKAFKEQGRPINLKVEAHVSKQWSTLPKPTSFYFPPDSADGYWNWEAYIKDCPGFLRSSFGIDSFSQNSVVVVVPGTSIGDKWKEGVPSGNHPIRFKGMKYLISLHPVIKAGYRTLMHEIGHCYGTDELYPYGDNVVANTEMFGMDMMGDDFFATGFMGYHRYRYGWMPFNKQEPACIYLTEPHAYGITLVPLSANKGVRMILIPDKSVSKDSLNKPYKLWGIEVGQDLQTTEQLFAGRNEKISKEGEKIIIYSVESQEQPGKRAIRLISKTGKLTQQNERWSHVFLYKDGETFQDPGAPMDIRINRNTDGSFYLNIQLKAK